MSPRAHEMIEHNPPGMEVVRMNVGTVERGAQAEAAGLPELTHAEILR